MLVKSIPVRSSEDIDITWIHGNTKNKVVPMAQGAKRGPSYINGVYQCQLLLYLDSEERNPFAMPESAGT